jgi:hypothetical protein
MSALTAARQGLAFRQKIKTISYPLAVGAKAWDNGMACYDTSAFGSVKQGAVSTTLVPIGSFRGSFDNTSGSTTVPIGVELNEEKEIQWWDSVTGGGAVTIANLFQTVYIASDHEVTTTTTGASVAGRVFSINMGNYPGAIGVLPAY